MVVAHLERWAKPFPMKHIFAAFLYSCFAAQMAAVEPSALIGTWRLVSATSTIVATGEKTNVWGTDPKGFLSYSPDGRMSVMVTFGPRPKPTDLSKVSDQERVQLYRTLLSYGGTFSIDGSVVTHHIDISSNESWTGTKQVRYAKLEGVTLAIATPAQPRSADGVVSVGELKWVKIQPDVTSSRK
jgi:hypothetical protein